MGVNRTDTMRSCALVGRLFLLLCFVELAKTACTTNTQPALTACPAGFYTSDTTTSCTECVNNQAQIRECGCEDTSSSCDGVYMKFYFSAEEKNNCTSSSSEYLSVSTAAYSKYLTFRENQMAGFWKRGHVKPDGSDVSTEHGEGASVDQAKSPAKVSWLTQPGHVSINLQKDPDYGPAKLFPYITARLNKLVVKKYPSEPDKKAGKNGVVIQDFGKMTQPRDWERYKEQDFFNLNSNGQVDYGSDEPWRLFMESPTCSYTYIAAAKITRRKEVGSSDVVVQGFSKVVPHSNSVKGSELCDVTMEQLDGAVRNALADLRSDIAGVLLGAECSVTAPANGAMGSCKDTLASGSECQPKCNSGYKASGETSCTKGTLTPATCVPKKSCIVEPPVNKRGAIWGSLGTCGSTITDGTTCQPTCSTGYHSTGVTKCSNQRLTKKTECIEDSCQIPVPSNGALAGHHWYPCSGNKDMDANGLLKSGKKCWVKCNSGCKVQGNNYCMRGKLVDTAVCTC